MENLQRYITPVAIQYNGTKIETNGVLDYDYDMKYLYLEPCNISRLGNGTGISN